MAEALEMDFSAPLIIGATGMEAIRQNIRMILMTTRFSIPLDRGFAHDGKLIDSPAPHMTSRLTMELIDAIEKYEPRVKVAKIEWSHTASGLRDGVLRPTIVFSLKKGVAI